EVADLAKVGGGAGLIGKAGQHALGFHTDPDIDLRRELRPNATGAGRRGALTDAAAIDHDHAAALPRQVEGQAATHDTLADDIEGDMERVRADSRSDLVRQLVPGPPMRCRGGYQGNPHFSNELHFLPVVVTAAEEGDLAGVDTAHLETSPQSAAVGPAHLPGD